MSESREENISGATFKPLTRSLSKQLSRQVIVKNASCFDNLSCHGSIAKSDRLGVCNISNFEAKDIKTSPVGSTKGSYKPNASRSSTSSQKQLRIQQVRRDLAENKLKLEQLRLEKELEQIVAEDEEEEEMNSDTSVEDSDQKVRNYLQSCIISPTLHKIDEDQRIAPRLKTEGSRKQQRDMEPQIMRMDMPKIELAAFYGETSDYWRFTKQFEYYIERRTEDPGQRMLYLSSYCKGLAMKAIKSSIALPPEKAYDIAKKRLRERFGLPHIVSRNIMDEIYKFPVLQNNDPAMLSELTELLIDSKVILEEMDHLADLNSSAALEKIVSKLPTDLRQQWANQADDMYLAGNKPNIDELTKFLDRRARIARSSFGRIVSKPDTGLVTAKNCNTCENKNRYEERRSSNHYRSNVNHINQVSTTRSTKICPRCTKEHELVNCEEFRNLDVDKRGKWVKEKGLCFLCLRPNHLAQQCRANIKCTLPHCSKRHNALLHSDAKTGDRETINVNVCYKKEIVQMGIVPVRLKGINAEIITYALLDNASESTFVNSNLMQQLGMKGSPAQITVRSFAGKSKVDCEKVNLTLESVSKDTTICLTNVLAVNNLLQDVQAKSPNHVASKLNYLNDVKFDDVGVREIGLLIGHDNPEALWIIDQRIGERKQPFAIKSIMGWLLLGPKNQEDVTPNESNAEEDIEHTAHNYLHECIVNSHRPKIVAVLDEVNEDVNLIETVSLVTTSETEFEQPKDLDLANPSLIVQEEDEDDASSIKDEVIETEICESSSITLKQELETRKYEDRKLLCLLTPVDKDPLKRSTTEPCNLNVCRQKLVPRLRIDMLHAEDNALVLGVAESSLVPDELFLLRGLDIKDESMLTKESMPASKEVYEPSKLEKQVTSNESQEDQNNEKSTAKDGYFAKDCPVSCNLIHYASVSWSSPAVKISEVNRDYNLVQNLEVITTRKIKGTIECFGAGIYVHKFVSYYYVIVLKDISFKFSTDFRETLISSPVKDIKVRRYLKDLGLKVTHENVKKDNNDDTLVGDKATEIEICGSSYIVLHQEFGTKETGERKVLCLLVNVEVDQLKYFTTLINASNSSCVRYVLHRGLRTSRSCWKNTMYNGKSNNVKSFSCITFLLVFVITTPTYMWRKGSDKTRSARELKDTALNVNSGDRRHVRNYHGVIEIRCSLAVHSLKNVKLRLNSLYELLYVVINIVSLTYLFAPYRRIEVASTSTSQTQRNSCALPTYQSEYQGIWENTTGLIRKVCQSVGVG